MRLDIERDELGQSRWEGVGVADAPPEEELDQAAGEVDEADELGVEPAFGPLADGRRRYDDDEEEDFALDDDYDDEEEYDEDYDEDLDEEFDDDEDLDEDLDEDVEEDV